MREFTSGANRDTSYGKFEYFGFIHPLCDFSFAEYMHQFRTLPDGSMRESDNWTKGIPPRVLIESLVRHTEDVKLLAKGLNVYEHRFNKFAERLVGDRPECSEHKDCIIKEITIVDALNGVRFNSEALKLHHLTVDKSD